MESKRFFLMDILFFFNPKTRGAKSKQTEQAAF
jgi:hypothetical protein